MKRAEEFETWERNKRKEQKYIRTRNCSRKIYFLPKQHNDATLTALENTMDEIDEEIQAARELFEEELLKINARADQNPNAVIVIAKILFKLDTINISNVKIPTISITTCFIVELRRFRR